MTFSRASSILSSHIKESVEGGKSLFAYSWNCDELKNGHRREPSDHIMKQCKDQTLNNSQTNVNCSKYFSKCFERTQPTLTVQH